MISQERLKQLLAYDQETGEFTWIARPGKRAELVGRVAGSPSSQGYVLISVENRTYKAHRLAFLYMTGEWPVHAVDHINSIKNDNRFANLRQATKAQNEMAKGPRSNNTSGVTGVYWSRCAQKWQAHIKRDGRIKYLGIFSDLAAARAARRAAEIELFGAFAPVAP